MSEDVWQEGLGNVASRFYRCCNVDQCGMRFPVVPGDLFRDQCPRCGSEVEVVAIAHGSEHAHTSQRAAQSTSQINLLLDNWRSLFNVGAAFRTADGAGLRHLYLCGITATPDTQRKLAKTALGAERSVAWSYHVDAVRLANDLQQGGKALWVLERGPTSQPLFDIKVWGEYRPVVLVAGNERAGVDPDLVAAADQVIHLPMAGQKVSLNVAVALSVAAYWLRAQEVAAFDQARVG